MGWPELNTSLHAYAHHSDIINVPICVFQRTLYNRGHVLWQSFTPRMHLFALIIFWPLPLGSNPFLTINPSSSSMYHQQVMP